MLFFFKQKTAYEMRISDWSSDVCSSDLNDPVEPLGSIRPQHSQVIGLFVQNRVKHRERRPRHEWKPSRNHFEQHCAECPDVRPVIDLRSMCLLDRKSVV